LGEHEVTARAVGSFSIPDAIEALTPVGVFEFGHEYVNGEASSAYWRLIVTATNAEEACRVVTTAMLSVPGLVVHEVRPGPPEPVDSDEAEEERFDAFFDLLDEATANEVESRIRAWVSRTTVGQAKGKIRLPDEYWDPPPD
jgi:hypothetical protein